LSLYAVLRQKVQVFMIKIMKPIEFIKMHGLGNDFVILDARAQVFENKAELAKKLGHRNFGVGCDQIIFIEVSSGADAFMRIYNPDGSESGACGNATRCVADILCSELNKTDCVIETKRGHLNCHKNSNGLISVDMGEPRLNWQEIPLARDCDTLYLPLTFPHPNPLPEGRGGKLIPSPFREKVRMREAVAVNMGNPHCVFFVDDVDRIDIASIGRQFEYDALFPERTNVEFVEVIDKHHLRMRVWERGSGITLACGSGACAVAVAAYRRGLTNRTVTISMDGGDLTLEWREQDNHVIMTGPVAYVFRGHLVA
jgi:diaminopimelate epimerase